MSRRRWVSTGALTTALALLVACTGAPRPSGAHRPAGTPVVTSVSHRMADGVEEFTRSDVDVRAVAVWVGPRRLVERYVASSAAETSDVSSVVNSVLSILIGLAIDDGTIRDTHETLATLLPHDAPAMSPQLRGATLYQVLTMTAGLAPDDSRRVHRILSARLPHAPGEEFEYSDAGPLLLSAILAEATGRPTLDFAREKLFDPLGIDTRRAGRSRLGFGPLELTTEDMAKIGRLMLAGGEWNGRRILSRHWVTDSTGAQVRTAGGTTDTDAYGYQWWVTTADGHDAFAAVGRGGQLIEVVPALGLVTVISGRITDLTQGQDRGGLGLVDQVIAPLLTP